MASSVKRSIGHAWFWGPAALSTALFVALVAHLPTVIFAGAGHDDAWFWHRARSIASGHWLGDYDQFTLMKGAGYPLFLAINHLLGMPLPVSQALLYSVACLLLAFAVSRTTGRPWLALLLLLGLQWHPMVLEWQRIIRDNIYAAQALLLLACLLWFLFLARSHKGRLAWAAVAGLTLGWFWSTREDGIWILPGIAILLVVRALQVWRNRDGMRGIGAGSLLMALVAAGFLALIATANWTKYGRFETVDVKGVAFSGAVSRLQQVRVGDVEAYVPVPGKVRRAVYPVSPTFARLQPYLEDAGRHWTRHGCRIYADTCGDYAGGWFIWALRDGVASLGAYESPDAAAAFYRALSEEVQVACGTGKLTCEPTAIDLMPRVTAAQWRTLPERLRKAGSLLLWRDVPESRWRSHLRLAPVKEMWEFAGKPKVPDGDELRERWLAGWFRAPDDVWLRMRCDPGDASVEVKRLPSPDVATHFRDPAAGDRRFQLQLQPGGDCVFEVLTRGQVVDTIALDEAHLAARHFPLDAGDLHFDSTGEGIPPSAQAPAWASKARLGIGRVYGVLLPWLAGAGLLAFAWLAGRALLQRRFAPLLGPLPALAVAAWCLVASRVALLALVDVSSFPAIEVQYMQPAFPLLLLASLTSLIALLPVAGRDASAEAQTALASAGHLGRQRENDGR